MQELVRSQKVTDEDKKQTVLEIIADRYCKQILHAALKEPMSAMEISSERKIPISTVYRRLQMLHDAKLLSISGSISRDGKKYFLYRSRVRSISLRCDLDATSVELVPNPSA